MNTILRICISFSFLFPTISNAFPAHKASLGAAAQSTLVLDATRKANQLQLEKALTAGANPNIQTKNGVTPLMLASYNGYLNIARVLLHFGANPNLITNLNSDFNLGKLLSNKNSKTTALMLAAYTGKLEMVVALIKGGADVNAQDSDGQTALIYAILGDQSWPHKPLDPVRKKIILALLEAGADAYLADNNGLDAAYYYSQVAGLILGFDGSYEADDVARSHDPLYKKMV